MKRVYEYKGERFYISPSNRGKQFKATFEDGTIVHFGDPKMKEYPGTKRGDKYCARSYGIGKKFDSLNNPKAANTLSRIVLWKCKGKLSMNTYKKANVKTKEEIFNAI